MTPRSQKRDPLLLDPWGRRFPVREITAPPAEPWLRGTLSDVPVLQRAVLHSLQMAQEDVAKWCGGLDDGEFHARPFGLPSVGFQLRHIARSLDRFCCYAEGTPLSQAQLAALASEMTAGGTRGEIFGELEASLDKTRQRLDKICPPAGRYAGQDRPQGSSHYAYRTFGPRRRAYPAACGAGRHYRKSDCC